MSPAHTDSGGVDEPILRVQVAEAEVVKISKVWFRVVELVDLVVVKDGGVEDVREGVVCVRVRGVNTTVTLQMKGTYKHRNKRDANTCIWFNNELES